MQDFGGSTEPDVATGASQTQFIHDVDMSSFMVEVIEKSTALPVIVSFWTEWSDNCKKLSPILEKLVRQAGGAVHLARINFEQNQQLAAQMKIQSVPTVVVFVNQRPVDAFTGVKSEQEIKEFIARFAPDMQPSPVEQALEQAAEQFAAGDVQTAGGIYSQVMQAEADNPVAIAGLAQCLIKMNDLENAGTVLDGTPKQHQNHKNIIAARAALDMAGQLAGLGDENALEQAIGRDANDHQSRFDLALVLWAKGQMELAADHLLEIVARDRSWNEDGARKQLVKFFEIMGPMDPFTVKIRKKLSSLLFS